MRTQALEKRPGDARPMDKQEPGWRFLALGSAMHHQVWGNDGPRKSLYTRDIRHKRLPGIDGYRRAPAMCARRGG